jgi:DNA (cytosine-5)-methyltransferase 1
MGRPRLLDLFCGAGGCSMGYHRAGFDVTGVDLKKMPRYPFEFHQADALAYLAEHGHKFDAIHASPPCQKYSKLAAMHAGRDYPDLLEPTRGLLLASGKPWVIENVESAPMEKAASLFGNGVCLCGSMFGLKVKDGYLRRHRLFESSTPITQPKCRHSGPAYGVYGHGGHSGKHRMLYRADAAVAMGIGWMSRDEMTQAIPPAYTEFLGKQLLASLAG